MAFDLVQRDLTATCSAVACDGSNVNVRRPHDKQHTRNGTAGSSEISVVSDTSIGAAFRVAFTSEPLEEVDWLSGTATVRLNITDQNSGVQLDRVDICRVGENCTSQESLASATSLNENLGTATLSVSLVMDAATNPAPHDRVRFLLGFQNTLALQQTFGITPSERNTVPLRDNKQPDNGVVSVRGETPGLELNVNPASGTMLVAGNQQEVSVLADTAPGTGSLQLSGNVASLGVSLTPDSGSIAASGLTPGNTFETVVADPSVSELSLQGNTVSIGVTANLEPGVGSSRAIGTDAGIEVGQTVLAGSLAVSGSTPGLGVSITPAGGLLSVAGDPNIIVDSAKPPVGSVSVRGIAPSVSTQRGGLWLPQTKQEGLWTKQKTVVDVQNRTLWDGGDTIWLSLAGRTYWDSDPFYTVAPKPNATWKKAR